MSRTSDFVTQTRTTSQRLIDAVNEARGLRREWDAMNYGETLGEEGDGAFAGENSDVTRADLAAFFTSMEVVETFLASGHASNFYKIRR